MKKIFSLNIYLILYKNFNLLYNPLLFNFKKYYHTFKKGGDYMRRVIILDISTLYAQIYDEIYCEEDEVKDLISKYNSEKFLCINLTYDKDCKVHIK